MACGYQLGRPDQVQDCEAINTGADSKLASQRSLAS